MLNFSKLSAPFARLRPQSAISNFANPYRQAHNKGRLFSISRFHFAESVGNIERNPERIQNFVVSSTGHWEEEQECEDEIYSSTGWCFIALQFEFECVVLELTLNLFCKNIPCTVLWAALTNPSPINNDPGKLKNPEVRKEDLKDVEVCSSISDCYMELRYNGEYFVELQWQF